jgi:hypothetical protein
MIEARRAVVDDVRELVRLRGVAALTGSLIVVSSQEAGQNSRQSAATDAVSVASWTLTPIWQFPVLPRVPEYCRDTHGDATPSFAEPRIVDHVRVRVDRVHRPPGHIRADRRVVPGRGRHELLQLLMIHAETFRHRLHRLPRPIGQQATHIQLALDLLIRPAHGTIQHLRGELDQPRTHPLDLLRSHTRSQPPSTVDIDTTRRSPNKALLVSRA